MAQGDDQRIELQEDEQPPKLVVNTVVIRGLQPTGIVVRPPIEPDVSEKEG